MEEYGWPTNFKRDEWKRDGAEIAERLLEEDSEREKELGKQLTADRMMAESLLRDQGVDITKNYLGVDQVRKILAKSYWIAEDGHIRYHY